MSSFYKGQPRTFREAIIHERKGEKMMIVGPPHWIGNNFYSKQSDTSCRFTSGHRYTGSYNPHYIEIK